MIHTRSKRPRISRKHVALADRKTWNWPRPDVSGWDAVEKKRFHRFERAITDYLNNEKVSVIEKKYSLRISQIQEQLARALVKDSAGQLLGFCALIPSLHVRPQTRMTPLPTGASPAGPLCKGGLMHLLRTENLYHEFESRVLGTNGPLKEAKVSALAIQKWLSTELTEKGYEKTDYPFNTKRPLYSSVARHIKAIIARDREAYIRAYGTGMQQANLEVMNGKQGRAARARSFQEVEIDEHKLHGIGVVRITIDGIPKSVPAERAVGIAIINRGTNAVLGGAVCLNPEAKADSLVEAIRSAVIPGYVVTLPNGEPAPPFRPGDFDASLTGILWSAAFIDNAKIHTGDKYLAATARMGAHTCYGPLGSWSGRPDIENLFGQVVRSYFARVPCTTHSDPDVGTNTSPADQAVLHEIDMDDLCTLFFEVLGRINNAPNSGLLNQSPINVTRNLLRSDHLPFLRRLPPVSAANPEVGIAAIQKPVKQRSHDNPNLYINYGTNKYTNEVLCNRADLKGQDITIHVAPNLRYVQAFELNGLPLGTLVADGMWGTVDHNHDIKLAVARDQELRFGQHGEQLDPVQALLVKKAKNVLKTNGKRAKGGTVKGALELRNLMHVTGTQELDIQSIQTIQTRESSNEPSFVSMNAAAQRARKARAILNSLKGTNKK